MSTSFQIHALPLEQFSPMFALSDEELQAKSARRIEVDTSPGYPCVVSLADAELGEKVILLPYAHLGGDSPYQSSGPIFVRENTTTVQLKVNEIPEMLKIRLLALRAYDAEAMMIGADVIEGEDLKQRLQKYLSDENVKVVHIHIAKPGCFNCRVERA